MRGRLWALLRAGDGGVGTSGSFETRYSGLWGGKIADAMLAEEECWRKVSRGVSCRACGLRSVLHLPSIRSSGGWEGYSKSSFFSLIDYTREGFSLAKIIKSFAFEFHRSATLNKIVKFYFLFQN